MPKKKDKKKVEEAVVEESGENSITLVAVLVQYELLMLAIQWLLLLRSEYDTMDLEMLREVVPMLRQQLEKSMLDRNYVQLERVSFTLSTFTSLSAYLQPSQVNFHSSWCNFS